MYLHVPPTSFVPGNLFCETPGEGRKTRKAGMQIDTASPEFSRVLQDPARHVKRWIPDSETSAIPIM